MQRSGLVADRPQAAFSVALVNPSVTLRALRFDTGPRRGPKHFIGPLKAGSLVVGWSIIEIVPEGIGRRRAHMVVESFAHTVEHYAWTGVSG